MTKHLSLSLSLSLSVCVCVCACVCAIPPLSTQKQSFPGDGQLKAATSFVMDTTRRVFFFSHLYFVHCSGQLQSKTSLFRASPPPPTPDICKKGGGGVWVGWGLFFCGCVCVLCVVCVCVCWCVCVPLPPRSTQNRPFPGDGQEEAAASFAMDTTGNPLLPTKQSLSLSKQSSLSLPLSLSPSLGPWR